MADGVDPGALRARGVLRVQVGVEVEQGVEVGGAEQADVHGRGSIRKSVRWGAVPAGISGRMGMAAPHDEWQEDTPAPVGRRCRGGGC